MLVPCEVATKCVLPVVRAMMAQELITKHKLTQMEAAKRIGVSQPAISLYHRKIRGRAISLEKEGRITRLIENLSASLAEGKLTHQEFIPAFCEICKAIRSKGLMCELHKAFDPAINVKDCNLCSVVTAKCM